MPRKEMSERLDGKKIMLGTIFKDAELDLDFELVNDKESPLVLTINLKTKDCKTKIGFDFKPYELKALATLFVRADKQ